VLAARIKAGAGDVKGARGPCDRGCYATSQLQAAEICPVGYLQTLGQHPQAVVNLAELIKTYPRDARLFDLQAKSYAAMGKRAAAASGTGGVLPAQGALTPAIEQLQLAQKSGDGDFYQLSSVEARLRQLRILQLEERRKEGGR